MFLMLLSKQIIALA